MYMCTLYRLHGVQHWTQCIQWLGRSYVPMCIDLSFIFECVTFGVTVVNYSLMSDAVVTLKLTLCILFFLIEIPAP